MVLPGGGASQPGGEIIDTTKIGISNNY
jgi:hypothetical protein